MNLKNTFNVKSLLPQLDMAVSEQDRALEAGAALKAGIGGDNPAINTTLDTTQLN